MSFDLITFIGVLGATIILIGFFLNQTRKLTVESPWYDGINALGSVILLVYAVLLGSYPFMVLNTVWFVVSVYGLFVRYGRHSE